MKFHSELSIGWIIIYACILASLPGRNSIENTLQKSVKGNLSGPDIAVDGHNFIERGSDSSYVIRAQNNVDGDYVRSKNKAN